jgi:hypothetical protein
MLGVGGGRVNAEAGQIAGTEAATKAVFLFDTRQDWPIESEHRKGAFRAIFLRFQP